MKTFTTFTVAMSLVSKAVADFYIYGGVISSVEGVEDPEAYAVDAVNRGNCDAIDGSPALVGADGNEFFPYPEESFTLEDVLCNVALRFEKDGDNFRAIDDVTNGEVGYCTKGTGEIKFCTWGLVSAEYVEDYFCASQVCP